MWDYRKSNYTPTKLNYDTALTSQSPKLFTKNSVETTFGQTLGQSGGSFKRKC